MSSKPGIENWQSFQKQVFALISERYSSKQQMVLDLEELLSLQQAVVYDRIALKRMLPLSECFILLRHYQITSKVISQLWTNKVLVNYTPLDQVPTSLEEYLIPLRDNMQALALTGGLHLYYAANELPFYHYYRQPRIALFKYFVWHMLSWKQGDAPDLTFDRDYIDQHLTRLEPIFQEIVSLYTQFSSTEVWHTNILHNTLHQIHYLFQIGLLPDAALAHELFEDLEEILNSLELMAKQGHKEEHPEHTFHLYHNEIVHTNNMALATAPGVSHVFFAFDNPNIMYANDSKLGDYSLHYFERLISHADNLSTSSNKSRALYFKDNKDQIKMMKKQYADFK